MADPKLQQLAAAAIDTYQKRLQEYPDPKAALKHAQAALDQHPAAAKMDRTERGHLALDSVLEYRRQSRDLPHDKARQQAAYRVVASGKEAGLDVKNYARSVIDSVQSHPASKASVLSAHASIAADEGRTTSDKAYALAAQVVRNYETARAAGMTHDQARERVAQHTGQRYDARADRKHGLDVQAYSKTVIEAYQKDPANAKQTVERYANLAAQSRNIAHKDAANVANTALVKYASALTTKAPDIAKTTAVQQVAQRFNDRGKAIDNDRGLSR